MWRTTGTAALAAAGLALLTACGGSGAGGDQARGRVSRTQFEADGKTWPLTVDSGTLACEPGSHVTFTAGSTTYAVNGGAKGEHRWPEIDRIWADDGSGLGLKKNIGDLIGAGLQLC